MRVLYVIDSLGSGGAQRQLVTLVNGLDRTLVEPEVAVYHALSHFRPDLDRTGTKVHELGTRGARDPRVLARLVGLIGRGRYDFVHSYLHTPGVLARVAVMLAPGPAVVVSERSVDMGFSRRKLFLERLLARRADALIANAEAIRANVEELVPRWKGRTFVVRNGIAWSEPDRETLDAAAELRSQYLKADGEILVGAVGRFQAQKNPHLVIDALELLPEELMRRLRVIWAGAWTDRDLVASLTGRLASRPFGERVSLVGQTRRIRSVYLAIDGLVLASDWEGFPNAVLEALAHGKPVVATDVGDVRALVKPGVSGWIVQPKDPAALASALGEFLTLSRERRAEMGRAGSSFVLDEYSVARLVERTMAVYRTVLSERSIAGRRVTA